MPESPPPVILRGTAPPVVPATIAFAAGIALQLYGSPLTNAGLRTLFGTLAAALAVCLFLRYHRVIILLLLPSSLFVLGMLHGNFSSILPDNQMDISRLSIPEEEVVLTGILVEKPTRREGISRMVMRVEEITRPNGKQPVGGLILLAAKGKPPDELTAGDRFLTRALLTAPQPAGSAGAFDYQAYLERRGIHRTGWIRTPNLITKLHSLSPAPMRKRISYLPEQIRQVVSRFLTETLAPRHSGLYQALLIGDRSGIPADMLETFTNIGCMHLLAISGMHMGLLALLVIGTGNWLLKRSTWLLLHLPAWKIAALAAWPPLFCYALIAGFQPPVVRALLMATVFITALMIDRQRHLPTTIAIAALLILLIQPTAMATVSFQLSFAAVIAIALIFPRIAAHLATPLPEKRLAAIGIKFCRWILTSVTLSMAATLGTLPLILHAFNRVSTLSPLSTLLIAPLLCFWSLPLGLLACLILPLHGGLAGYILRLGSHGLTITDWLANWLSAIPWASIWLPTPSFGEIVSYYGLITGAVFFKKHRWAKILAATALIVLIVLPIAHHIKVLGRNHARVNFIDVGQGASILLELPGGKNILIDGGARQLGRFDPGVSIIAPFLWRKKIRRLESVVISHPHSDHYNGLSSILQRFKPKTIWINGHPGPDPRYAKLLQDAARLGCQIIIARPAIPLYARGTTTLSCLGDLHLENDAFAGGKLSPATGKSENNKSLVLALEDGENRFLFAGDIEQEAERELINRGGKLAADVLQAPHHGSSTSSSMDFFKAVQPRHVVVSAGKKARDVYADNQALQREYVGGTEIHRTARWGTVEFAVDKDGLSVTRHLPNPRSPPKRR